MAARKRSWASLGLVCGVRQCGCGGALGEDNLQGRGKAEYRDSGHHRGKGPLTGPVPVGSHSQLPARPTKKRAPAVLPGARLGVENNAKLPRLNAFLIIILISVNTPLNQCRDNFIERVPKPSCFCSPRRVIVAHQEVILCRIRLAAPQATADEILSSYR